LSYTPHSKIPTPRGFPDPNIHTLGRHRKPGSQDPAQVRSINFALVGSEKIEAKGRENFFCMSVGNACETDLVSLRLALKRKFFFAKPAHPNWEAWKRIDSSRIHNI
jgi:hypothetical protein